MDYKGIICKGYCKHHGSRADFCNTCGDFCGNFQLSETAKVMIGEEILDEVTPLYAKHLEAAQKAFEARVNGG